MSIAQFVDFKRTEKGGSSQQEVGDSDYLFRKIKVKVLFLMRRIL